MSKKIQCDICGKLMDHDKELILYEIHSLKKINTYDVDRYDEIENDICSNCYDKLKHIISEKEWKDNMIPNEVLEKCFTKDNIMSPPRIVDGIGM